jgi:hypothetical protein
MIATNESLGLGSVKTFAELSGVTVEGVIDWVDSQPLPCMKLADFRMINLARLRADLEKGKTVFSVADCAHV